MSLTANSVALDDLLVMGTKLKTNIQDNVTKASIELTTDQVSQITIDLVDPGFKILKSGIFNPKTPVRYQKLNFIVSTVSTKEVSGNEGIQIKCRPKKVYELKQRRGAKVMSGASPSEFVKAECQAVGAKFAVQDSPGRSQVARDVQEKDKTYQEDEEPSSWTTFQRLARELGYIVFELNDTVYFGKPTWFVGRTEKSPFIVNWKTGSTSLYALTIPACSKSLDSKETTISLSMPLDRTKDAATGIALKMNGVPTFTGNYMIKSISYDLAGVTETMSVEAGTPIDPVAQPPVDLSAAGGPGLDLSTGARGGYTGGWPLPSQYKATGSFGVRGSWAAGYHTGTDFAAPAGTPVYAVYDGSIEIGGWGSAYGNHVLLKVGKNKYGFCHLSKISVHGGQKVTVGTKLGEVGQTGRAFGNHLHLEYRVSPWRYGSDSKDPIPTLRKKVAGTSGSGTGLVAANGQATANNIVTYALSRQGGRYKLGATRYSHNVSEREFDCSSLINWCFWRVGIKIPDLILPKIDWFKRNGGKQISVAQGLNVRGAILIRTVIKYGNRHIGLSLGNGGGTIEAVGTAYGVRTMKRDTGDWQQAWLSPKLKYGTDAAKYL